MKQIVQFLIIFLAASHTANSQPTLTIKFSNSQCTIGDTLLFEATYKATNKIPKYATLHVTINNTNNTKQWRLRYPMVNGVSTAAIVIPDSLEKGVYFFNYRLQREMVHIMGRQKNEKPEKVLSVMAKAQNKEVIGQNIALDVDGYFQMPNLLFEGKASFVFSPAKKYPVNWLELEIETPIDSAFVPMAESWDKLAIGVPLADTGSYKNDSSLVFSTKPNELLNVTVTAKRKTMIELYQQAHVTGMFDGGNSIIFDGLEVHDMSPYQNALHFLSGQVMGLNIGSGGESADWRGFEPVFFVDEVETEIIGVKNINGSDIAMIKVFRPPFYGVSMGSAGGAIAVYTKRGDILGKYGPKYRFVVNGYTPQVYKLVN